tara:strand:- start:3642 stop:4214 length:573 start_codon:yes stop_codon:yes gene_type:complete
MKKTEILCNNSFSSLKNYLEKMFNECPNDYFQSGPRGSALKMKLDVNKMEIKGHEVSGLAEQGLISYNYKSAHSNVQLFMLERDDKTLAVEVPIWLNSNEIQEYKELFNEDLPLTGHIDALRVEEGKIWVWDYKPKAHLEKYASCQVYFYALMLSRRTGIPLGNFMCGYFDDDIAYVFKPEEKIIKGLVS